MITNVPKYNETNTKHLSVKVNSVENSMGKPVTDKELIWNEVRQALVNALNNPKKMEGYELVTDSIYYYQNGDWAIGGFIIRPTKV